MVPLRDDVGQPETGNDLREAQQGNGRGDLPHDLRHRGLVAETRGERHEADAEHPVGVAPAHAVLEVEVVVDVAVEVLVHGRGLHLQVAVLLVELALEEGVDDHDHAVPHADLELRARHPHEVPQPVGVGPPVRVVDRLRLVARGDVELEPVEVEVADEPQLRLLVLRVVHLRRRRRGVLRGAPLAVHAVAAGALLLLHALVANVAVLRRGAVVGQGLAEEIVLLRLAAGHEDARGDEEGPLLPGVREAVVAVPGKAQVGGLLHGLDDEPARRLLEVQVLRPG